MGVEVVLIPRAFINLVISQALIRSQLYVNHHEISMNYQLYNQAHL